METEKRDQGQLSIFMGITLILIMGMLAFIINVGLFVKAKINLQNAVDAAAFSGAATQARQLTNIAYLNWEMRNTFKEWMFKYYVLGQFGLIGENTTPANNLTDSKISGNGPVNFLLRSADIVGATAKDPYNIPSICIHNNTSTNICQLYTVPGIPRFPALGVAGISEIHESFVNTLVSAKAKNCSDRTQMNFLAALSWAYSSGIKDIPGAPTLAVNRAGAWPEALEIAMRIRNLEMIMNRPPVSTPIDFNRANQLSAEGASIGLNERTVKAFTTAFRNLSGGKYKNEGRDELSGTFTLTELSPTPFIAEANTTSGMLIPQTFTYMGAEGTTALQKHYVDLQVTPINYAPMFTTLVSKSGQMDSSSEGAAINVQSECTISKTAIPVPGYLMGFVKNPSVVTYYAVKGEAQFTGLFFPRISSDGPGSFKLTAYAAAKPFGGRIGPKLFGFSNGDRAIIPREDINRRTSSYISGIRFSTNSSDYKPGMPIPNDSKFWVDEGSPVLGGVPQSGASSTYGIPNLIYDFANIGELTHQSATSTKIQMINPNTTNPTEDKGLFHAPQFRALKSALGGDFTGTTMNSDAVLRAIVNSRQVTHYDAINYLIPDASGLNTNAAPQIGHIPGAPKIPGEPRAIFYRLYAPMLGDNLLYKNTDEIVSLVGDYMKSNESAIRIYLESLLKVGESIYNLPPEKGVNLNVDAAQSIHYNAGRNTDPIPPPLTGADASDKACQIDMASKFYHFFTANNTQCGIVPLKQLMGEYINKKNETDPVYYQNTYLNKLDNFQSFSAYFPSTRQGATSDGLYQNPLLASISDSAPYSMRRNFYSTKFVSVKNLVSTDFYKNEVFMEAANKSPDDMMLTAQFKNPLKNDGTTDIGKPFFGDF